MKIHTKVVDSISFRFVWFIFSFSIFSCFLSIFISFILFRFFFFLCRQVSRLAFPAAAVLVLLVLAVIFSHLLQFNSWYLSLTAAHSAPPHSRPSPLECPCRCRRTRTKTYNHPAVDPGVNTLGRTIKSDSPFSLTRTWRAFPFPHFPVSTFRERYKKKKTWKEENFLSTANAPSKVKIVH